MISVLVPTLNAAPYLPKLLDSLLDVQEVIILDSSSQDNTASIAQQYGVRVEVIPKAKFDHGGTRNRAAKLAIGEFSRAKR
jgi:rhamnosyltransferase